jgi:hypothetical protein
VRMARTSEPEAREKCERDLPIKPASFRHETRDILANDSARVADAISGVYSFPRSRGVISPL